MKAKLGIEGFEKTSVRSLNSEKPLVPSVVQETLLSFYNPEMASSASSAAYTIPHN